MKRAMNRGALSLVALGLCTVVAVGCGGNTGDGGTDSVPGFDSGPGTDMGNVPGSDGGGLCTPPMGYTLNMPCADPMDGDWGSVLHYNIDADASAAMIGIDQIQIDNVLGGAGFTPYLSPETAAGPLTFPLSAIILQACSPMYGASMTTITGLMGGMAVTEPVVEMFDAQDCQLDMFDITLFPMGGNPCGDGACDALTENNCNCPMDCVVSCGDGCCSAGEDNASCPGDCP